MMFSKPCHFVVTAYLLLTANADTNTVRGVQQRELEAPTVVNLGTAGEYAILTKAGIFNVAPSSITGNIAVSPIAAIALTGFSLTAINDGKASKSSQFSGKAYAANYMAPTPGHLTTAVSNMETAYTDAAGRTRIDAKKLNINFGVIGGEIFGIFEPGVYTFGSSVTINSELTFKGSATDVFIIQISNDLIIEKDVKVILRGGALARNIFWQVAERVMVGERAHMEGILLAKTSVLFEADSRLNGRILAQTACTLEGATITEPPSSN